MSLSSPLSNQIQPSQVKQFFSWCEKSFVNQIGGGFNQQLDSVLEQIKITSNKLGGYQEKQAYTKMYETLVMNKVQMHDAFNSFLQQYFQEKIVPQTGDEKFDYNKLSIISEEQVENDIVSKSLEKKLSEAIGDDLNNLSTRMEYLLGENKNPFSAEILASALTSSLQKIFNDISLQKQIVQIFSSSWPETIKNTFQGMNEYLVANDVLVDVRNYHRQVKPQDKKDFSIGKQPEFETNQAPIESPNINQFNQSIENTSFKEDSAPEDIMSMFSQILNKKNHSMHQPRMEQGNGFLGGAAHVPNFSSVSYQTMQTINELQKQFVLNNQNHIKNKTPNYNLNHILENSAVGEMQFENVIKNLNPQTNNQFDQLIIDIISNVFDKIFSQKNVPEHIKFLIGKLQLPVLKSALQDKKFFLEKDSAPRLFLELLSTDETVYNPEYLMKFEKIIDKILSNDETDSEIFLFALQQVQALLKDQKLKENQIIDKSSLILENDERSTAYVEQIIQFSSKMTQKTTYEPVKVFIENIWAPQFSKKWTPFIAKEKTDFIKSLSLEAKVQLNHAVLVFDMMIWSTQIEEKTTENIEKLSQYIPKIRDGLNKICKDLSINSEDASSLGFLLAEKHLYLIQKEEEKKKIHEQNIIDNEQKIVQTYKDKNKSYQDVEKAQKEIVSTNANFDDIFIKGQWFNFSNEKIKMKLLWVSPRKTLFLFNNPKDKKVYRFDKSIIWNKFKNQTLIALPIDKIDTDILVSSAVKEMNNKLH